MDEKVKKLLEDIKERLWNIFKKELTHIILYGSYVRGDYDEESDIDIMVLVKDKELKKYNEKIIDLEIDMTIKYGIMPSILIENKEYVMKNKHIEFLFGNVLNYGQTIYAAWIYFR